MWLSQEYVHSVTVFIKLHLGVISLIRKIIKTCIVVYSFNHPNSENVVYDIRKSLKQSHVIIFSCR